MGHKRVRTNRDYNIVARDVTYFDYHEDGSRKFLRNTTKSLPNCTAATAQNIHNFHIHRLKNFKTED